MTTYSITTNRIAFIQANWHAELVGQIRAGFFNEYITLGGDADDIQVIDVAGALEIPLHAQIAANSGAYDAIVCAAMVVDGGIYRHEFVATAVIDAMMRVQLETGVPVMSVVLTPQQFEEQGEHYDFLFKHLLGKGQEAAASTVQTIASLGKLKAGE